MKVLLLLAGRSKRFWPLTEKSFFPICGTTLLDIQIAHLKEAGLTDITLVGGAHNLPEAHSRFPSLPTIEQKDLTLGMQGALLSSLPHMGNEPVMVVCGNDVVESHAYRDLVQASQANGVPGCLLAKECKRYFPGGYLSVEGERITGITEKPGEGNTPSDLVNIVAHVHSDPALLLAELQKTPSGNDDGYERALTQLFSSHVYHAVPYNDPWIAVKYPWHVLALLDHLLSLIKDQTIHPSAQIHPSAIIDGPVRIAEGVRVMAHATVRGPCTIGKGSVIANNALVRNASIGERCVVGFGSEVKSSVLAHDVWTHMTYLGDSVIGSNVSFGGGCITGNLRLDEGEISSAVHEAPVKTELKKFGAIVGNDCRFGIHVSTNPGVKVGAGSFVSAHLLLSADAPDGSFATLKNGEVVIRENRVRLEGMDRKKPH
ncbi:MAG: NTP transferase domain-containing protein [Candidatus Peregrinibacteria bacterium]